MIKLRVSTILSQCRHRVEVSASVKSRPVKWKPMQDINKSQLLGQNEILSSKKLRVDPESEHEQRACRQQSLIAH